MILMGRIQQVHKKYQEKALEFFNRAIEMEPDYHLDYINASALLLELEKFNDAIKNSKKVIERAGLL
jgi:tetratricopeptide (TPR) repeat protein